MQVSGQLHAPVAPHQKKRAAGTLSIGSCVDSRVGLEVLQRRKTSCFRRELKLNPSVVQTGA